MRIRLDAGRRVVLLAAFISLLIAITGLFDLRLTGKMRAEFFTVARRDVPLSALAARIETLQRQQADILQQALAPAGTVMQRHSPEALTAYFVRTGFNLRKALDRGKEIAQAMDQDGQRDAVRARGMLARQLLGRISEEYDNYERRALGILQAAGKGVSADSSSRAEEARAPGAELETAIGVLLNDVEDFTERSADAVMRHVGTKLGIIVGFTLLAYLAGVLMLLQIRGIVKERREAQAKLTIMATYDSLSGLFNRRHFLNQLEVAIAAAHRYEHPLSLCICDLDGFKQVNDTHGHGSGDEVIRQFGNLVREGIRADDFAGRYGGDEFVIALNHTPAGVAGGVLERIRSRMARLVFNDEKGAYFQVSATFGVADLDPSQPSPRALIESADLALYQAKRQGRNCIVTRSWVEASWDHLAPEVEEGGLS